MGDRSAGRGGDGGKGNGQFHHFNRLDWYLKLRWNKILSPLLALCCGFSNDVHVSRYESGLETWF